MSSCARKIVKSYPILMGSSSFLEIYCLRRMSGNIWNIIAPLRYFLLPNGRHQKQKKQQGKKWCGISSGLTAHWKKVMDSKELLYYIQSDKNLTVVFENIPSDEIKSTGYDTGLEK